MATPLFDNRRSFSELDEKFFDGLLTRVGKDFTRVYYDTDCYLEDYAATLGGDLPTLYHVEDSWANYDKGAARVAIPRGCFGASPLAMTTA